MSGQEQVREWVDSHVDYLDREREVPLYGLRATVVLDENGKTGFSWCIDNPDDIDPFAFAGMLTALRNAVLRNVETTAWGAP